MWPATLADRPGGQKVTSRDPLTGPGDGGRRRGRLIAGARQPRSMKRREASRTLAALVGTVLGAGCLSNPPGATGPRTPPRGGTPPPEAPRGGSPADLRVVAFDFEEAENGRLRVVGRVANDGVNERTVVLVITVRTDEGEVVERPQLTVDAGSEAAFGVVVSDVGFEQFQADGELDIELASAD